MNFPLLQFLNQSRQGMGMRPDNNPAGNPGMRPSMQPGMGGQVPFLSFDDICSLIRVHFLSLISSLLYLSAWFPECTDDGPAQQRNDESSNRGINVIFKICICVSVSEIEFHIWYLTPIDNVCSVTEVYDLM